LPLVRHAHITSTAQWCLTKSRYLVLPAHLGTSFLTTLYATCHADIVVFVHLTITIVVRVVAQLGAALFARNGAACGRAVILTHDSSFIETRTLPS
jgi:hypothetical protein